MSKNVVTLKSGSEVTQGHRKDTCRSATYDFLLTFLRNHGPISYRFRDKRRLNRNFFHSRCILRPRWRGFLGNWVSPLGVKNYNHGGTGGERRLTISSVIWIQSTNVTDRRTDRPSDSKDRAYA